MNRPPKLREVAKRAIREQISAAALARFRSQGFQDTTVEHIASDVGMSTRTFFRYFRSKDDVLLEAVYAFRERLLESLEANLPSGDLWCALSVALEASVLDCRNPDVGQKDREMQALIRDTPSLLARQLEVMEKLQVEVAGLCNTLGSQASALGASTVHAIIGSAFACYHSSQLCLAADATIDDAAFELRELMQALRPSALQR